MKEMEDLSRFCLYGIFHLLGKPREFQTSSSGETKLFPTCLDSIYIYIYIYKVAFINYGSPIAKRV